MPRGPCALMTLAVCAPPPTSYFCASQAFGARTPTGYKLLSNGKVLERIGSERIETTIRKRHLGFTGALIRQGDPRLSKRVMFRRLAVQGPKRGGRPATSSVDCLQKFPRPSAQSRAKAKDGSGSYSELLSSMDQIIRLLRRTSACCTGGSRGE